jgi:amino acid adenylation domain-containing protein
VSTVESQVPRAARSEGGVVSALTRVAADTPTAPALLTDDVVITYDELVADVAAVVSWLHPLDLEEVVAIEIERSHESLVAFIAVLFAGGTALLVDPSHPQRRRDDMVRHSRATRRLRADDVREATRRVDGAVPRSLSLPASSLAYVCYTSGSTGFPKGVAVTRRALEARIEWGQGIYPLGAGDGVLWHTAPSFDFSIWEMLAPLAYGGCVVVGRPRGQGDLRGTARDLSERRVTAVHFVPSVLRAFLRVASPDTLRSLRYLFVGGEPLDGGLLRTLQAATDARILNQYGPTESCIDSTWFDCTDFRCEPGDPVPIGRAAPGVHLTLVGGDGLPSEGDEGELAVGGSGVARGYLHDPRATADRFVPTVDGPPGSRLYRTGDLVRRRPDGCLEFRGRLDDQVKVNGVRIELEEIRRALQTCAPGADMAVALRLDGAGGAELVAFVATEAGTVTSDALALLLPEPMIPRVVPLQELTRLPSGKVDIASMLAALGDPPGDQPARDTTAGFATGTEARLAAIWADVLSVAQVRAADNFFELGGHSLMATEVVALIEDEVGVELPLAEFFECETLADLARLTDDLVFASSKASS